MNAKDSSFIAPAIVLIIGTLLYFIAVLKPYHLVVYTSSKEMLETL